VAITALFAYRKGPVAPVAPPISAAKVILAANVYQQDELRGVKEVIRSFRRFKKSGGRPEAFSLCLGTHVGARKGSL
jgi:hypothetical protein